MGEGEGKDYTYGQMPLKTPDAGRSAVLLLPIVFGYFLCCNDDKGCRSDGAERAEFV